MTASTPDASQRTAARVVGFSYLFAMVAANVAEFGVHAHLLVSGDAAATAHNILAHERLWRLGIACNLLCMTTDLALIAALYVILSRVHQGLALFATCSRVVETSVFVVVILNDFDVLRIVSGADHLQAFGAEQVQALARLSLGAYGAGYGVGLILFGLGSAAFGVLWFKSRYIPRLLAAWGVFASLLVAAGSLTLIVFPNLSSLLIPGYFLPVFLFEIIMGFWLLIKGLRPAASAGRDPARA